MSIYSLPPDIIHNKILQFSSLIDIISLKLTSKHFNEKINVNKIFNVLISRIFDKNVLNLICEHHVAITGFSILGLLYNNNIKGLNMYIRINNFSEDIMNLSFVQELKKYFLCSACPIFPKRIEIVYGNIIIFLNCVGVHPLIFIDKAFGSDIFKVSYYGGKIHLKNLTKLILRSDYVVPEPLLDVSVYKDSYNDAFSKKAIDILEHRVRTWHSLKIIKNINIKFYVWEDYNMFNVLLLPLFNFQMENSPERSLTKSQKWEIVNAVLNDKKYEGTNKYLKTFLQDLPNINELKRGIFKIYN